MLMGHPLDKRHESPFAKSTIETKNTRVRILRANWTQD